MRIGVVIGSCEYLLPHPVDTGALAAVVAAHEPGAVLAPARWAPREAPYHTFLYADRADRDRRVALFLEYLGDALAADATAIVILPFEPSTETSRNGTIADERIQHFLARAQATFGEIAVRCWRMYLSDTTQAVLKRLGERTERGSEVATATTPIAVDAFVARWPGLAAALRNYTEAVLRLAEPIVTRSSIFTGDGRAALVARLLEQNRLSIRADLGPDRILEQLQPGGELFELMCHPLPPAIEPVHPTTLAVDAATTASGR